MMLSELTLEGINASDIARLKAHGIFTVTVSIYAWLDEASAWSILH
jgi:hypothetical protein